MRSTVCILAASAVLLAGCCTSDGLGFQLVKLRPQETGNWCWAASTQMPLEFSGELVEQCAMANRRFNRNDCCSSGCPKNDQCNRPAWTMFSDYGYDFDDSPTPLAWSQIKDQICKAKKPLAFAYGPKSGGVGHVVVIYGFNESNGRQDLMLKDPWAPCVGTDRSITYQEYSASATRDHWSTMYNIEKKSS